MTVIIKMPGTRKLTKGTPMTSPRLDPIANVKIRMNRPAVTSGAAMVWVQTLMNRRISRLVSV